ncbi:MAG: hypothetical protein R6X19_06910 [Kiritimatiellia bacterium]
MATQKQIFLCYDLKGIQSFIFAVPRLRYICGGSALLDVFDRETVPLLKCPGTVHIFSGGGKGAFTCESTQALNILQQELVKAAHADGMSICFGVHEDYSEAAHLADRSFPYLPGPNELEGQPCPESGLYPTVDDSHPMIAKRIGDGDVRLDHRFEKDLLVGLTLPDARPSAQFEFFHDVSPDSKKGRIASQALGDRNRWAIVTMDGNDIGAQHRDASSRWGKEPETFLKWLQAMSRALDECSRHACRDAIQHIISLWVKEHSGDMQAGQKGAVTLPLRPLIVGGDDIVVLCRVEYAMEFVKLACQAFEERSAFKSEQAGKAGITLWPATNGRVTLTAGILYAPISLPLATAIPYAELILASAKKKSREHKPGEAAPACVDWESVTEGLLINPHTRRQGEMLFWDEDIQKTVQLTRRPYTLREMEDLLQLVEAYRKTPNTIRHQVLPHMKAGYWDRQVFTARLGKNQERLANDLGKGGSHLSPGGRWKHKEGKEWSIDVIDALLLLEEDSRMDWKTVI